MGGKRGDAWPLHPCPQGLTRGNGVCFEGMDAQGRLRQNVEREEAEFSIECGPGGTGVTPRCLCPVGRWPYRLEPTKPRLKTVISDSNAALKRGRSLRRGDRVVPRGRVGCEPSVSPILPGGEAGLGEEKPRPGTAVSFC